MWKVEYRSLNENGDYFITNGITSYQTKLLKDAELLCTILNNYEILKTLNNECKHGYTKA